MTKSAFMGLVSYSYINTTCICDAKWLLSVQFYNQIPKESSCSDQRTIDCPICDHVAVLHDYKNT